MQNPRTMDRGALCNLIFCNVHSPRHCTREGQRPFPDSLPPIPSPLYLSLSFIPSSPFAPLSLSLSQSTSFPSFIDFFAVVDSRYYYGRARGRWLSTTRPRLTCFASFFLCARLRLRARGKEGGIAKSLSMPPPAQNVADPRARAPCQSIAPSTAVMTPFFLLVFIACRPADQRTTLQSSVANLDFCHLPACCLLIQSVILPPAPPISSCLPSLPPSLPPTALNEVSA